jgi:hypothetical protein
LRLIADHAAESQADAVRFITITQKMAANCGQGCWAQASRGTF